MRHRIPVVVHVLLVAADRVLLLRRAGTGRADGCWAPPGGHLEADELPSRAAVRECEEEVGLRLDAAMLRPVATLFYRDQDQDPGGVGVNVLFSVRLSAPRVLQPCSGADACDWWPADALPAPRVPWLDDALRRVAAASGPGARFWYGESEPGGRAGPGGG